ncbi:sensor domain-containing protein [Methyloversatilis thermotolerans]|uniref:sensor domain-containing protein n=1 Tax=Methyloversatilis thermotolerans TaxID=1346290 RepID=UPI00036ECE30|nr:EAL domain-containing protein [Methyloversatilis thermotolerans]
MSARSALHTSAPVFGLALLVGICMGLIAFAHHHWDASLSGAITARDNLAQSRRYALLAQLDTERLLAGDVSVPRARVLAHLDRALVVARDLREGHGALIGFANGYPPSGEVAASTDAYIGTLADARIVMERQLSGFEAGGELLRLSQRAIDARATAVEAALLHELSARRALLRTHDRATLILLATTALFLLLFLYLSHRRRDIALDSLVSSEGRLRAFVNSLPDVAFMLDRQGRYIESYGSSRQLLAAPPDTLIGRTLDEVFPEEVSSRFLAVIRQALARQRTLPYSYELDVDDRRVVFDARVSPVPGSDRVVWVAWDVTARQRAEERAHQLTRLYNFLSQVNQTIVWSASEDELFDRICRVAVEYGRYRAAWVLQHDSDPGQTGLRACAGLPANDRVALADGEGRSIEHSVVARVTASGRMLRLTPLQGDAPWMATARVTGCDACVALPLQLDDDVVAVLFMLAPSLDVDDEDEIRLLEEVSMDISFALRRLRDERSRRQAERSARLLADALRSTRDGVVVTDARGHLVQANAAFCAMVGEAEDEVVGRVLPVLLALDAQEAAADLAVALADGAGWQGEVNGRRRSGERWTGWLSCAPVQEEGGERGYRVCVLTDTTSMRSTEAQLEHLSHYDPLTDLPNRVLIRARLGHAIEQCARRGDRIAVICVDIDHFKTINDSLGHASGDEVLSAVAQRLRMRLRRQDTLGRQGGDEFVLVLENVREAAEAARVAEDVKACLAQPIHLASGQEIYVQVSMGISMFPEDGDSADELLRDADGAMYQAKQSGRNGIRFYTDTLKREATRRLSLDTALRRALENDQVELRFQPLMGLQDGRLLGAEVLVRLSEAADVQAGPGTFVPLMEANGLIVPLGNRVRELACRQGRAWLDAGLPPISLAVNVSAVEIRRGGLQQRIECVLSDTGFPPSLLELEMTESSLMDQGENTESFLDAMEAMGIRMSVDDFGTGYSSLAYLKRLPVHTLKIDRSFVCDLPEDASAVELVDTIITLGHKLGLSVLAEGVETAGQHELLKTHGCDASQGYFHARPLTAAEFERRFLAPGALDLSYRDET